MSSAGARLDPDQLASLEEQRDFLLRSLADLDREHDAGDLDDLDYVTLRDDYTARAAEVLRSIDEQRAAFSDAKRPRSTGRTVAVLVGVVAFAVIAGVVVAGALGARKPGDSVSGGVSVQMTPSQQANECNQDMSTDPDGTFTCLQKVLDDDPENPVALTWSAWLLSVSADSFEEGDRVVAQAQAALLLEKAVTSDPNYSFARAFRAIVAYRNGRPADAKQYLQEFEDHNPSAQAAQVIKEQGLEQKINDALAAEDDVTASTTTSTLPAG